jgi:N-acyl-D-amino-acid deacylase
MTRALSLLLFLAAPFLAADYDLVIRNARVVDGSGNPWFRADVAVKDGRIAAVGRLAEAASGRSIDAQGRVLAPGFIDIHTHIEGVVEKVPTADNYVRDGVTTVVTGNCGGSARDLGAWFEKLEKLGVGLNVASHVGHNTVRRQVMGAENRQATPDEIAKMQALVEQGMRDGAVGLSTGLIYIPGTYANTEEVVALAKVAAKYGGIYASHMRDEGAKVLDAITAARGSTGLPGNGHFKIDNRPVSSASQSTCGEVPARASDVISIITPTITPPPLGIVLPSWVFAGGKLEEPLKDAATRARIKREMQAMLKALGHKDYSYATVASFAADKSYEGKNISQIHRLKGRKKGAKNEVETILELMAAGAPDMVYHSMSEKDVDRIMRYPNAAVGSDGGIREFGVGVPHPRSYGTRARVLGEFVRHRGVITLEEAVRKMTSLPARTLGFRDRGLVREGMAADLVLFDPAKVQDKATYQQPHQYSEGFDLVVVNGVVVVDGGKVTGARPGKVLRGAGAASQR